MSVEKAIVAQARPHMLATRVEAAIQEEVTKGCRGDISAQPVALEPPYHPISPSPDLLTGENRSDLLPEPIPLATNLTRLQLWLSPEEEFSWLNSELFLKQLRTLTHRVAFEIVGNSQKIQMQFLVHRNDLPIFKAAFRSQFERCELSGMVDDLLGDLKRNSWNNVMFLDCFPPAPYSHLLTRPDELKVTTYRSVVAALMEIDPPAIGFYQALFQPVKPEHNWYRNVQILLDLEYTIKLVSGLQAPQKYLQQAPSGDLRQMAWEVETKAHNDKPFYAAAIRLGILSPEKQGLMGLNPLSTFVNLFQHGGRPLQYLREQEYKEVVSLERITQMFLLGLTYRSGFLVNSSELAGIVHIPPAELLEYRKPPMAVLQTLPVPDPCINTGTPLGTYTYAGVEYPVCIPPEPRSRSTHIIARPGQVKSTTMARMILDDIGKGKGVAVLDPHGDLIEDLLCLIKEEHVEKTIYFDPGNPNYVPIWNPLRRRHGQDLSRTSDDLVASIKAVVTGWGDRLEHLLKHGLYGLLQLPDSTLLDLSNLLRKKSTESDHLRQEILKVVDNQTASLFWDKDFNRYPNEAFDPPKHKLSKLLLSGTVSLMLSQPESLIDFRKIMDEGMILLVNLSTIGSEVREILGCFMLSLFHIAAITRSDIPKEMRKEFHIYLDEAHRFITDALEDIIAETRKFSVSLTLAHHFFSQFGTKKIDALSSVGTTIIMNVDSKDARYLTKDLRGLVQYEDLINLKLGEAIVRIGTEIVRVTLPGPLEIPEGHFRDAIIQRSHRLYYKPIQVVRDLIRQKDGRWGHSFSALTPNGSEDLKEFIYDEF